MSCSTSSLVSQTATQPGTSGEYAPYEFSPFSMMTKILAISILFLYVGLFQDTEQCSNRHVLSRMPRDRYYSLLCRVLIMSMISTYPRKIPTISFIRLMTSRTFTQTASFLLSFKKKYTVSTENALEKFYQLCWLPGSSVLKIGSSRIICPAVS